MTDTFSPPVPSIQPDSPLQVELDTLKRRLTLMTRDWEKLNELMNEHADSEQWCSEYDEKLDYWNSSFSTLQLSGRIKDYDVKVRVRATYYTTVTVSAISPGAARDRVCDYDTGDVMENQEWDDPYDCEFEIDEVQTA